MECDPENYFCLNVCTLDFQVTQATLSIPFSPPTYSQLQHLYE